MEMPGLGNYRAREPRCQLIRYMMVGERAILLRGWRIGTVVLWEWGVPR